MAYRDPYAVQYGRSNQYTDGPEFNPYPGNRQPHATYDQDGYEPYDGAEYRDEPQIHSTEHSTLPLANNTKETSVFEQSPIEK